MIRLAAALTLLAIALLFPGAAFAQQLPCAPYQPFKAAMEKEHHELPVARAIQDNGYVMEILASKTGTYTILIIRPDDNLACAVAAGTAWGLIEVKEGQPS